MAEDTEPCVTESPRNSLTLKAPSIKLVYLQCYFVTIATILGTGILGLPVTLSDSGIYPFLVSFLAGFLIQTLLIVFFTDLLQRAHAVQLSSAREGGPENVPLNDLLLEDEFDDFDAELEEEHETNGPVMAGHIIIPKDLNVKPPNLHLLGELFLPCGVRQFFDIVLLIQFIALLISYALAGSESYAAVLGVDHFYVIPAFVWCLTFAIVFALNCIQPLVSILTFAKGSLLLGTVIVTFFVGASIHHEVSNDFSYVGAPFLMGTVALGGIVNVMPFLYTKVQPVAHHVKGFRTSIISGLATCTLLNILWCWSILEIVPQKNSCFVYKVIHNNSIHSTIEGETPQKVVCSHNLSLESAAENGEISTIPLTQIIHQLYPGYDWVALLVELFIMISITVSFLTIGAAMYHTLSGWIESALTKDKFTTYTQKIMAHRRFKQCSSQCVCRVTVSLLAFSVVFVVAMLNPQGFEQILEKAASLFINLEVGLFVFMMLVNSLNSENRKLKIPLPLSPWVYHLIYLIPIYFNFAVIYDLFATVYQLVTKGAPLPWEHKPEPGIIIPIEETVTNYYSNYTTGYSLLVTHTNIPDHS